MFSLQFDRMKKESIVGLQIDDVVAAQF